MATAHEAFDEDAASVLLLQRLVMAARAIPSFSIATSLVLRRRWRVRARRASSWLTRRPSCCLLVGSRRVVMSRRCASRRRARPLRIVVSKAVDAAESLRSRLSSEHPERLPSAQSSRHPPLGSLISTLGSMTSTLGSLTSTAWLRCHRRVVIRKGVATRCTTVKTPARDREGVYRITAQHLRFGGEKTEISDLQRPGDRRP